MTPAQIAKIMSLVDDYAAACFNFSVHGPQQGAARAAVEAALSDAPQAERTLTDEQIKRHSLLAADCPGASTVILVSSLRRLLSRPSAPTAVEPDERTPQDYAIEHAEYMAQSAAHLIACVNDLALAEQQCEDGEANQSDVDAARESLTEAQGHLKSSIYEFRKRQDRASKGTK